jgi:hypothetical protein
MHVRHMAVSLRMLLFGGIIATVLVVGLTMENKKRGRALGKRSFRSTRAGESRR